MSPKVFLVTGCSSGLGLALVKGILARGDIAIATLRKPSVLDDLRAQYPDEKKLVILELDVTKQDQIKSVFETIKEKFGQLDVVISNAGIVHSAELEGEVEEEARRIFEVNFWGNHYVSTAAVTFFRDVNKVQGGHFILIGSYAGVQPFAGLGMYGAAKAATLSATEALHHELPPVWNIKTTSVILGAVQTPVAEKAATIPIHPAYEAFPELLNVQLRTQLAVWVTDGQPADAAAGTILDIVGLERDTTPIVFSVGADTYGVVQKRGDYLQAGLKEHEARTKGTEKEVAAEAEKKEEA